MATTQDAAKAPGRPKGGPGMIIILLVVLVPSLLVGNLVGAGGASIVGGFVALFGLISSMGGSLRPDLARLAFVGPLIALGAVAPRLLGEVTTVGAIALAVAIILVAGLLPIRGHRYDSVGLAVGMGTLFGYAIPFTGIVRPSQLLLAGIVGLVLAFGLRVLLGLKDPSGPTRKTVGDVLEGKDTDFGASFDAWLSDHPVRWLGEVLVNAGRFRIARATLLRQDAAGKHSAISTFIASANERAATLATAVRSKKPETVEQPQQQPLPSGLEGLSTQAAEAILTSLVKAEHAFSNRDKERVPLPSGFQTRLSWLSVKAGFRHGSIQVRHAYRTALAILLALIVSTFLRDGDPLLPTLLMTTFGIMQVSLGATLTKARDRLLGLLAGGIISVVVILFLPAAFLLPISLVGVGVGMWFITARPAVGVAGILVMSVGLNTELRHLQPLEVVVEYVILTAIAVLIAVVIGFGIIPAWRPRQIHERVNVAVASAASVLTVLGRSNSEPQGEEVLAVLGDASAAAQQLVPAHDKLTADQEREVDTLHANLQDLLATALFLTNLNEREKNASAFNRAAVVLTDDAAEVIPSDDPRLGDAAVVILAQEIRAQRTAVLAALNRGAQA